jgi:CRISPR-associated protein Csm5
MQDNRKLPKQQLHWTVKDIAKSCNSFYMELFWKELHAMKDRNYLNSEWLRQIEQLLDNGLLKRLDDGDAFLLRVGRHSGAEALTLNGVRSIRIMQGRGQQAVWENQPKTWWLAADDISTKQDMLPFGWILVEIDPKAPDSQLQQWFENSHSDLTAWMKQQLDKQNSLKQKAEVLQQQEQQKIQAEQQRAEEMRLLQEAEETRRGTMTEQQLQIETLTQHLQEKQAVNAREQIGGPLYSSMRELINQASEWSNDDKTQLLNVAKLILEWIGAGSNKKAKELLKMLQ